MKRLVPCQFCRGALETRRKSPVGGSKWRIRFPSKLGAREYEAEADERDPGKRRARGSQIFQSASRIEWPLLRLESCYRLSSSRFVRFNFSILLSVKIPSINVSFQLSMLRGIPLKKRNEEIFFVRASIEKGNEIRGSRAT